MKSGSTIICSSKDECNQSQIASALKRACSYFIQSQNKTGDWEGEMWWCPLPTAQVVLTHKIIGHPIADEKKSSILHYFAKTQRPDGGWGFHDESHSYRYVTTLVYVAARLLGMSADDPMLRSAHRWLDSQPGGVDSVPTHGKFWLAILGLYDWHFVNIGGPEVFLTPRWFFLSPTRFYCHTRSVYRGMVYLKGVRFQYDLGFVAQTIRNELYGSDSKAADSSQRHASRHTIALTDVFHMPARVLRILYDIQRWSEGVLPYIFGTKRVRQRALAHCLERILAEQRTSNFQGLSSLSSSLNILALWHENPNHSAVYRSVEMLDSWCWTSAAEGTRYAGARSLTWDTAFTLQALTASHQVTEQVILAVRAAYHRLHNMQITNELPIEERDERDSNSGGWCFNDSTHQWAISDCTAEVISALLSCHHLPEVISLENRISVAHLQAAIGFLLTRQNADGGFGSYERSRGMHWMNNANPTEIYGNCMAELSYIECTASVLRALYIAVQDYPELGSETVRHAINRSIKFLCAQQRSDGTWLAAWGVNLIYSTWFAVEALCAAQLSPFNSTLQKAAAWLKTIQHADGGWGEHFSGCHTGSYVDHPASTVVSTSWASLALLAIEGPQSVAGNRGIMWLVQRQQADGTWSGDAVNGVFFRTALLNYRLYSCYFPTLALAKANPH